MSLWDQANDASDADAAAKQQELARKQQVWAQLVPLFDEFAETVREGRLKPSVEGFLIKPRWDVYSYPHRLRVDKAGEWNFDYPNDERADTRVGSRKDGLVDEYWLLDATVMDWRAALVSYIQKYRKT